MNIEDVLARIEEHVDRNSHCVSGTNYMTISSDLIDSELKEIWKDYQRELHISRLNS